ncbi:MAG: hypothetical protein H6579_04685 [Chitinophagales bacterium]|nr:hypothetical protein [Bacteroidota bacterium]MCB9256404.1 hypothetical protein [Chitinophagales bacterium]
MESFANIGLWVSYVLIFLALLGMFVGIVVAVMQSWNDGGLYAVVGVVALIVFFGIGYALSSDEVSQRLVEKGFGDAAVYKRSSAGLITFYALAIVASVLLVFDVVKGFVDGN